LEIKVILYNESLRAEHSVESSHPGAKPLIKRPCRRKLKNKIS
jgi:hypothetical protein